MRGSFGQLQRRDAKTADVTAELRGGTEPQVRRVCRGHGVPAFGSALVRQQKAEPPLNRDSVEAREADLKSRGVDQPAGIGLRTIGFHTFSEEIIRQRHVDRGRAARAREP